VPSATGLTGATGEYYVAAELSRRQWLATVTIKNSPGTDVLAQRLDRRRIVAVQTKTASPGSKWFRLGAKDEDPGERDNEWYVFIALRGIAERPSFYVVPRHHAAAIVYLEHQDWLRSLGHLQKPARSGAVRNDSMTRSIWPKWVMGYLERWDLLDESAWEAPFLGEPALLDLAVQVPLPSSYRPLTPAP
jgi:hypothetical protein